MAEIRVGDRIQHRAVPGFAMTVQGVEPCGDGLHESFQVLDPAVWLCEHDVERVT